MTSQRLAAVDAQFYWMSSKLATDEFLLYAFDGDPGDLGIALATLRRRALACRELTTRIEDSAVLCYPRWVRATVEPGQVVIRRLPESTWAACLAAVAGLNAQQLDATEMAWRVHLFPDIAGIPGANVAGPVVVLQVPHAVADGGRASALAAWLFGRPTPLPDLRPPRPGPLICKTRAAVLGQRRLRRDIEAGLITSGAGLRPARLTNIGSSGPTALRTLVRQRRQLSGPTVTVAALSAISEALAQWLTEHGCAADDLSDLAAEVPMAKPGKPQARNHFSPVTARLYPDLDSADRMRLIAEDLDNARQRLAHPATTSADEAFAATPAPVLRWGVRLSDPLARPAQVAGNTVVSSVYRGPADLHFGAAPVLLTAGFPALSPAMGLTHGVHGIGEVIAISVRADHSVMPDIDGYLRLLDAALQPR